ncbi:MAG TPA: hypothetical protein VFC56_05230 [Stellaceae bacterium]|nr:hypothetical protein [Stellaceae bacterium]
MSALVLAKRLILAMLYGLLFPTLLGSAQAEAPNATNWPIPPVGEKCVLQTVPFNGIPYTVTRTFTGLVDGKYCSQVQYPKNGVSRTCVNSDGNPVEINGWQRSPHSGFFSWPFKVSGDKGDH